MPEQQKVALDIAMSELPLILVLQKENKQYSDVTWQRYKFNLRNLLISREILAQGEFSVDNPRATNQIS